MADGATWNPPKTLTFVRPDPTKFVLLIARTGRGTVTLPGTESMKPGGTEWATPQDLDDAGYVSKESVRAMLMKLAASGAPAEAVGEALGLLGLR